ncbi:hypothetical protein MTAT_04530 [Moorella thermoacetica]|uniref:Uncharacterized protein n=1 Tax=Neomoorella thermoacetica TaxID=1525 RepID=A0AAC9MUF6_NEOTH|nr:hypothetical protein [Moorella thermoacetica]AOQ24748.1 hypothetical protein Maut_02320 [Moorella thermoacetica]TYL15714.1 hypothetical protein MTAT_04530 [Moorella thermoacetica]
MKICLDPEFSQSNQQLARSLTVLAALGLEEAGFKPYLSAQNFMNTLDRINLINHLDVDCIITFIITNFENDWQRLRGFYPPGATRFGETIVRNLAEAVPTALNEEAYPDTLVNHCGMPLLRLTKSPHVLVIANGIDVAPLARGIVDGIKEYFKEDF